MQPPRNYADPAQTVYIPAGMLRFGIEYRRLQNDQGICIHVFRGPNDQQDEILRFDCFERQPHYHYAWSTNDHYVPLDTAAEGDPVQWTLARLRMRMGNGPVQEVPKRSSAVIQASGAAGTTVRMIPCGILPP